MVIAKSYEPPKSFLRHSVWRFSPSLASWFVKVPAPEPRCCRGGVGGDVPWQPDGFFDEFLAMGMIPSGKLTVCYWKWPIEIVDLPSYKMVDLSIVMLNYQRVKACWLAGGFAPCWLPFCKKTSEVCPFFPHSFRFALGFARVSELVDKGTTESTLQSYSQNTVSVVIRSLQPPKICVRTNQMVFNCHVFLSLTNQKISKSLTVLDLLKMVFYFFQWEIGNL